MKTWRSNEEEEKKKKKKKKKKKAKRRGWVLPLVSLERQKKERSDEEKCRCGKERSLGR